MFLYNGNRFNINEPFTGPDGTQYPAGWFLNPEHRTAIGIVEVTEETRPDDRFYWVTDNGDGTFTSTPKDLDNLKAMQVTKIKNQAGSILAQTDWKVIRAYETGTTIDTELASFRQSIREHSNDLESQINGTTTVEELIAVNISEGWATYGASEQAI